MAVVEKTALAQEVAETRRELFNLKLSAGSGQIKDTSQFKKLRKKIARLLTQVGSGSESVAQVTNDANGGE